MKKSLSAILAIIMAVVMVPSGLVAAFAATSGDYDYTISGSNATITAYTGSGGSITIPTTLDSYNVTAIGDSAFNDCTSITDVIIQTGVTSIGNYAFQSCTALTSITIPASVLTVGNYAFQSCTGLTSATIPDGVTSIGNYAYQSCTGLTSVTIPDSVISIGNYAFQSCTNLTSVTIPDGVTSIGSYAFQSCTGLTSVTIPDSVISIGEYAFALCSGLTSVTLPDSITGISAALFYYCTSITSVTIPESVTSIGASAFSHCTGLTSVIIPDSVTTIGDYAFQTCTGLTSVAIPDSVTAIGAYAFSGCTALTSITIPSSVTSISAYAFINSSSVIISCYSSAYAYTYAVNNSISYKLLDLIAVTGVTLSAETVSLTVGNTNQLTATVLPNNASVFSLSWSSSSTGVATVSSTGLITAKSPGTTTIKCIAKDGSGNYDSCSLTVIPKAVTSPKAVSASYKGISLTWTSVSGSTGYAVFRATSKTGFYHYIAKTTASIYTDNSLTTGQTYYYKIKAYKTVSNTNYYSVSSSVFYAKPIPSTPGLVKATRVSGTSVKVSWNALSGAKGYVVYRYYSATKTYQRVKVTTATSFTNANLKTGYNYYYKVRAYREVNGTNVYGNPSAYVVAKTY